MPKVLWQQTTSVSRVTTEVRRIAQIRVALCPCENVLSIFGVFRHHRPAKPNQRMNETKTTNPEMCILISPKRQTTNVPLIGTTRRDFWSKFKWEHRFILFTYWVFLVCGCFRREFSIQETVSREITGRYLKAQKTMHIFYTRMREKVKKKISPLKISKIESQII